MTGALHPAAVALVDDHLARLAAALGPDDAAASDMLDEVRDGLLARTERLVADGAPPDDAARLTLHEFGVVPQIAPALIADVTLTRARAAAVTMLRFGPVAATVWVIALLSGGPAPAGLHGAAPWSAAMVWLGPSCVGAVIFAVTAYAATSHLGRPRPRLARRAAAAATVACTVTDLAAVACIAAWTVSATVSWPVAAAVALVSCVRIVVVGRGAPRLLRPALA